MISSFFGKTKPINYIVLSVFLFLFYCLFLALNFNFDPDSVFIPLEGLALAVLLLTLFLINQIVKTEKVTEFSSYAMLFFVLLFVAFSDSIIAKNTVFANFFLLLAIWRLLAIKSIKNVKHKIFDASFLITVASLFYDWALIFLILVFVVINVYDRKTFKNWIVPIIAVLAVFILTFTTLRLFGSLDFFNQHYIFPLDFLTEGFFYQKSTTKLLIYAFSIVIIASLVFLKVRQKGGGKLVILRIVFLAFILGIFTALFRTGEPGVIAVTFFPAAVFLTNFLESIKRVRLREVFVSFCIIFPVVLFILELNR